MSEHWLTDDNLKVINLLGYTLSSSFSRSTHIHGGVCIYVKSDINFRVLDLSELCIELDCEMSAIELIDMKVILCSLYRSPLGNIKTFLSNLEKMLLLANAEDRQIIVAGDFNLNFEHGTDNDVQYCNDIFESFNMFSYVTDATRVTLSSSTRIDNLYTNIVHNEVKVLDLKLSDHRALLANFDLNTVCQKQYITRRCNIKEAYISEAKLLLKNTHWEQLLQQHTNCNKYDIFEEKILNIFDKFFPVKTIEVKPEEINLDWRNENFCKQQAYTDFLADVSKDFPECPYARQRYVNQKILFENAVRSAKIDFNTYKIFQSNNTKKETWNIVNKSVKIKNVPKNTIPDVYTDDTKTTKTCNSKQKANAFNDYFKKAPSDIYNSIPQTKPHTYRYIKNLVSNPNCIFLSPTTCQEVLDIFKTLTDSGACDVNFLSPKFIKLFAEELCAPLTILINDAFKNGEFPDFLKISRIMPIFKKGDKHDPANYRPISILPVLSKIFEKLLLSRLTDFLKSFDVINENQHGFLKNKNTTTAIFSFIDYVLKGLDEGELTIGLFFDLSKAFDCVDHEILLFKLEKYGIRGAAYHLIKSYLSNRKQFVALSEDKNYVKSELLDSKIGVPQGSILGPLLFILYINDLVISEKGVFVLKYADDTTFVIRNKNKQELINQTNSILEEVNIYFKTNKLQLNPLKTGLLGFQITNVMNKYEECDIEMSDVIIPFSGVTKLLGANVDKNVKWNNHIDNLCKRLSKVLFALRILKQNVNKDALKLVYFAHFHSLLMYCIEIWGHAADYLFTRVFKLQKRAIRIITGSAYDASCRNLFKDNNILSLPALYITQVLVFVKKQPKYFQSCFFKHHYETRHKTKMIFDQHKTSALEKGLLYSAQSLYNKLPEDLRNECNPLKFKSLIKSHLFEKNVYKICEY